MNKEYELKKLSQGKELELEFNTYINCCLNNVDLQYRRLGLYNLANIGRPNCWQVHCEDSRYKFSQLYWNLKDAVEKFIELKHKLELNPRPNYKKKTNNEFRNTEKQGKKLSRL